MDPERGELCRVIGSQTLWSETVCCVRLPGRDTVMRLPAASLRPVHEAGVGTMGGNAYLATGASAVPFSVPYCPRSVTIA